LGQPPRGDRRLIQHPKPPPPSPPLPPLPPPAPNPHQTREHAQLAKTLGVVKLIVVVNKLDDSSVVGEGGVWSQERYDDIVKGLTPFLKSAGYNPKKDLTFIPISALSGHNVKVGARRGVAGGPRHLRGRG
jgi:hypothetical protein